MLDAEAGCGQRFRGADHAAAVILVSNNAYHLTSVAGAGTRARLDAGVLGDRHRADPRRARRGRALRGYDTEVVIAAGLASIGWRGAGREQRIRDAVDE